jgi:hypothetical protein
MFMVRRVAYRARILTQDWIHRNAFLLGLTSGATLTVLVLLVH